MAHHAAGTAHDRPKAHPTTRDLLLGFGRAFAGAVLFALPMLMTMEMWRFGAVLPPLRIAGFVALALPVLIGLVRSLGFRNTPGMSWRDHIADAFVGYAVGVVTAAGVLALLGLIGPGHSPSEVVGRVAIESVPTSIGAVVARGQFGAQPWSTDSVTYPAEILLMAVGGGLFVFNIAPTEEVVFLATTADPLRVLALAGTTIVLMHVIVYAPASADSTAPTPPGGRCSSASPWSGTPRPCSYRCICCGCSAGQTTPPGP